MICTICGGPFDMETEGGRQGSVGILPVAFCPMCLAGIMGFAEQEFRHYDPDYLKELIDGWENEGTDKV